MEKLTETDLLIENIFIETCTHTKMQVIFMSFKLCFKIKVVGKQTTITTIKGVDKTVIW